MKAYLIDPVTQFIRAIKVENMDDIKRLIGFDTVESDELGNAGDRLYFEEECCGRAKGKRFQVDNKVTVCGKGVIVGTRENGKTLCDPEMDMYGLNRRLKYL